MAKRPSKRQNRPELASEEINITPIMNLFIILIPFLLLSAVFVNIGVIETSLPIVADDNDKGKDENKHRIALKVAINRLGFLIKGTVSDSSRIHPRAAVTKNVIGNGLLIRQKNGKYNFDLFQDALQKIKADFPDEDTLIIMPESYILYDTIIETMDAAREIYVAREKKMKQLFPKAVIGANI